MNKHIYTITKNDSTATEFCDALAQCTPEAMHAYSQNTGSFSPFFNVFGYDAHEKQLKMHACFEHTQRLGYDVNTTLDYQQFRAVAHVYWHNTALHAYIANECFDLAEMFFDLAPKFDAQINLSALDIEKKTPLMLAIKTARAPLSLIKKLITPESFNLAEATGATPLMVACAMRRVDIVQALLQQAAEVEQCAPLDFTEITAEQKNRLAPYINQQHPENKKSLGHYALLRVGTDACKQKNSRQYQMTVHNILRSVGIDGDRDENATANSPVMAGSTVPIQVSAQAFQLYQQLERNGGFKNVDFSEYEFVSSQEHVGITLTPLTYIGEQNVRLALLASMRNAFYLSTFREEKPELYRDTVAPQLRQYSGTTLATSIMRRSGEMLQFLINCGLDLSLSQTNGNRSVQEYVSALEASNMFTNDDAHLLEAIRLTKSCENTL